MFRALPRLVPALAIAGLVAASLVVAPAPFAAERSSITLRSGVVDTTGASSFADGPDASLRLVQFDGPVTAKQMEALRDTVEEVFTYLPQHAFLVRVDDALDAEAVQSLGARWTGPYLAAYKVSPEIAASEAPESRSGSAAAEDATRRPVLLHVVPDRDVAEVVAKVEALVGQEVVGSAQRSFFSRVRLLLTDAEIAAVRDALAALDEVVWIEKEARRVLTNETTAWVGQSGLDGGQATPVFDAGLLGDGQIVGVLDTGVDIDSCYFRDPDEQPALNLCDFNSTAVNNDHRKVIAVNFLWDQDCDGGTISDSEWDSQGHGTHVGGTVAADNLANPGTHDGADGMAPEAKLVVQDCGYAPDNCADCPGIGACPVVDLNPVFQQAYDQGARIHTNSWGDEENDPNYGEYTAGSQDADEFMWNNKDFLLFFAAGNNGGTSNTVDSPSTGKNVVSVGSTLRGSSADTISGFSSRGPTEDGRIKPDVTNPGSSIISARSDFSVSTNNCDTRSSSGTSMATPGAAGFGALIRQYFMDGYYPSGAAVPFDAFTPSAALVKAVLINSGTTMANQGSIPSNSQGWGRVLLDDALHFTGDERALWVHDEAGGFSTGLAGGALDEYQLEVTGGEPLEVTLTWTDFPASVNANPTLVNDLDLEVIGPDGTFLGNVLAGGASQTGGSADRLNTVEVVIVADPSPGAWTVRVKGWNVPSGPQPYAVAATGGSVAPCGGPADLVGTASTLEVTPVSGDGDLFVDNCESADLSFAVSNRGDAVATNPRIVSVSSPSHPDSRFGLPAWSQPSLAGCANTNAAVTLDAAVGLSEGDTLLIDVELTFDEIAPQTRMVQLAVTDTERDLTTVASRTWSFESGLDEWTVDSGTFARTNTIGGADGSTWYLQSSADQPGQCDAVLSPEIRLTETSTLTLSTSYDIEDVDGLTWWDRANISLVDQGASTLLIPDGGRPYDAPNGAPNGTCGTTGEAGWAGTEASWAASTWSAAALGATDVAGRPVRLDVRYGTDPAVHGDGFRFDQVTVTDILDQGPDLQPDVCLIGEIFRDGFETGDSTRWTAEVP